MFNPSLKIRRLLASFAAVTCLSALGLSAHALETVEKICTRVVILRKGRVAAHDSVDALRDLMHSPSLEDIFTQLVVDDDTDSIAAEIVNAVSATS